MQPGLKHKATENITKHGSLPFPHRSSSPIQFSKTGDIRINKGVKNWFQWELSGMQTVRLSQVKCRITLSWRFKQRAPAEIRHVIDPFYNQFLRKDIYFINKITINNGGGMNIERFHMTSARPYWCSKTMKRLSCWCSNPIPLELNSCLM